MNAYPWLAQYWQGLPLHTLWSQPFSKTDSKMKAFKGPKFVILNLMSVEVSARWVIGGRWLFCGPLGCVSAGLHLFIIGISRYCDRIFSNPSSMLLNFISIFWRRLKFHPWCAISWCEGLSAQVWFFGLRAGQKPAQANNSTLVIQLRLNNYKNDFFLMLI